MLILKPLINHPILSLFTIAAIVASIFVLLDDTRVNLGKDAVETIQPIVNRQITFLPTVNKKKIYLLKVKPENTVLIFGEIGENAAGIANRITSLSNNSEPTVLLINSPGGSVMDGTLVISAIEASKTPVYAVCMQLCASMASLIHGHAHKRLMVDRSILMFHPFSGAVQGNAYQMNARLSTITRYVDKMDAVIAARAGLPLPTFLQMQSGEMWIDAEDSVNQKFADGLVNLDLSAVDSPEFKALVVKSTQTNRNHYFNIQIGDF
jgi:ATP-dependent protease ClpP protease subunit